MTRDQTAHEVIIPMLVAILKARKYVELGVHQNETVSAVREAAPDCQVYAVDRTAPAEFLPGVNYRIMATRGYLEQQAGADGPFDIAFIDADHEATAVLADFEAIWQHMAPEGLVLLHDGNPETVADTAPGYCDSAWEAIRHISQFHEAVTLPYHPGLTIVRKRVSWGPALPAAAGKETEIARV